MDDPPRHQGENGPPPEDPPRPGGVAGLGGEGAGVHGALLGGEEDEARLGPLLQVEGGKAQDPPGAVGEKLHEPLQGKAPLQVELGVEEGEGHLEARDAEGGP